MFRFFAVVAIASLLCGCGHQKIIGRDDLRSGLTAAISLASETQTFIDYAGHQRATANFAQGHLAYLVETARQSAKELHESAPVHSIAQQFPDAQQQLDALARQLSKLRDQLAARTVTPLSIQDLNGIRHTLEQIQTSL